MAPDAGPFRFTAALCRSVEHRGMRFVHLPEDLADVIEGRFGHRAAGFGSIKVEVTIGATTWSTSLFPDDGAGTYVLPLKAPVCRAEGIDEGDEADVELRVVVP